MLPQPSDPVRDSEEVNRQAVNSLRFMCCLIRKGDLPAGTRDDPTVDRSLEGTKGDDDMLVSDGPPAGPIGVRQALHP